MQDNDITYRLKAVDEASPVLESVKKKADQLTNSVNRLSTANTSGSKTSDELTKSANTVKNGLDGASKAQKNYIAHITKTTILSAAVNKAFLLMVDSMGQAVKQADLIANFPASMGALGLSTKEASEGFAKLKTYIQSVGGDLTKAAVSVTRFAGVNKNIKASVAQFAGLNNALIAGGASAEVQASALEQMTQAYSRGRPQLIEWKSAMIAMAPQLDQVAKKMGYINAGALGSALSQGDESMQKFMTTLTQMGTGIGPIANQALARMQGIQFAATVMKNTLTNGLTAIYQAFGRQTIVGFFTAVTQAIALLCQWVVVLINLFVKLFNIISKLVGGPQIGAIVGDAAGVADTANAVDDLGTGLDNASDSAKALSKSLAGFDKMNVLPEKTSGKDSGSGGVGGTTGSLGTEDASALGGIFDELGNKFKEVNKQTQIFAGILAALAANQLIAKIFGINPLKLFFTSLGTYVLKPLLSIVGTFGLSLAKGLLGMGSGGSGVLGSAAVLGGKIGLAIKGGIGAIGNIGWTIFSSIMIGLSGLVGAIGGVLSGIGTVVFEFFAGVGAAAALPEIAVIAIGAAIVAAIVALIWLIWTNWDTICKFMSDLWNTVWTFITNVFTAFWNWLVGIWNTLYDIFAGPIIWIWQFITATFTLIVAVIAIALEAIWNLVVWLVTTVLGILATIAMWIYNNVIMPVVNFFVWLWKTIVDVVTAAWKWIFEKVLAPIGTWIYNNVISPVFTFFKNMWDAISGFVSGFVTSAMNFLLPIVNWIKTNIIDKISGFFSGLWNGILSGINGLVEGIKTVFNTIVNIIKTPINGIIDAINGVLKSLNKIKVPDWVPFIGGSSVNFPMIPKLARGGVVTRSTMANIGENGSEAIVPLENNTEWIDKLAAKINAAGGGGQPVQLTVQIGEEKIVTKIIDLINEKTQMSGRNAILV